MNQVTFGKQIKAIRLIRGIYQETLAQQLGVSRPTLVAIERDQVLPTPEKKQAIEAALNIRFDDQEVRAAFAILAGGGSNNGRS